MLHPPAQGLTPQNVLKNITSGDKYGNLVGKDAGPVDWTAQTTPSGYLRNPFRLVGFASKVGITINTYNGAGYWLQATTTERAETLLHELGHAFNFMSHRTGGFTISNTAEIKDKYAFDKVVNKNCFQKP